MAEQKKTVKFIIERQDSPTSKPYTQEFEIPYRPALNVVASLMEIQKNPVTTDAQPKTNIGTCSITSRLLINVIFPRFSFI